MNDIKWTALQIEYLHSQGIRIADKEWFILKLLTWVFQIDTQGVSATYSFHIFGMSVILYVENIFEWFLHEPVDRWHYDTIRAAINDEDNINKIWTQEKFFWGFWTISEIFLD